MYFIVWAVRGAIVRWFIPIHSGFIPFHSWFNPFQSGFIPFYAVFIPFHKLFIPIHPVFPKLKDPEKYLGPNFFLFNLAISVNFGAGF